MQTVQLLGGRDGRLSFLRRARAHLAARGCLAIAISESLEPFEVRDGIRGPTPDMCEINGVVYASHPTAVRVRGPDYVLERRREVVDLDGARAVTQDRIQLDRLSARQLRSEAMLVELRPEGAIEIPATGEYVGSTVVMFGA
jgi:hypothetical protein